MAVVGIIASYPARADSLRETVVSLAKQVDRLHLVLNEYTAVPPPDHFPDNVVATIPPADLKDTGKFAIPVEATDICCLCDDDIRYPPDYVERMRDKLEQYRAERAVVGLHGVIYSDFFDGSAEARIVHVYNKTLEQDSQVNQLGTGTVVCYGWQMPSFIFMSNSQRFVDVRFARHCADRGFPMVCAARDAGWLQDLPSGPSLFETFTQVWPPNVVREANEIGGLRRLTSRRVVR